MKDYTDVDLFDPDASSPEEYSAALFFTQLDFEGGIEALWRYGGEEAFPEVLRSEAIAFGMALEELSRAITDWGNDSGVRY